MAERGAGLAYGVGGLFGAVVIAVSSVSTRAPVQGAPASQQSPPAAQQAAAGVAGVRPPGVADTTRLTTGEQLVREFVGDAARGTAPVTRSPEYRRQVRSLEVLIATVPDPVDSRLDWAFDSHVAAIRRAHERTGYVIDRFWLPWGTLADTLRLPAGARVREAYPGVLLFRRLSADGVHLSLVYLVGEVPTRGVHRLAMRRALDERGRLGGGSPLKIIGPAFSGSSLSLRSALDAWPGAGGIAATVISGSATNCENLVILESGSLASAGRARIDFSATVHSDEAFLRALEDRVFRPLKISPHRVVILLENSTGYGQNALSTSGDESRCGTTPPDVARQRARYTVVPFPMNISRLRAEYARRPVSTPAAVAAPGASSIPVDLSDPGRPLESPPVLSSLTVPAMETAITEIASTLTRRRAKAVVILASDVRDKMFLAGELRRRARDVQVFTFESNALFLAPDRNQDLRGMVVVSTYPLFLANQWWTGGPEDRERFLFPNEGAQGVYNATVIQLGADTLVAEYVRPGAARGERTRHTPPVWITAVGAGAFVPVAMDASASDSAYMAAADVQGPGAVQERASLFLRLSALVLSLLLLELSRRALAHAFRSGRFGWPPPDEPSYLVAQVVRCVSLSIHGHLYRMLGLVTALSVWMPVAWFFIRATEGRGHTWLYAGLAALVLAVSVFAMLVAGTSAALLVWRYRAKGTRFALRPHWGAAGRQVAWLAEILARVMVAGLGIWFLAVAADYAVEVAGIRGPDLWLYLYRVSRVDAGVTPLLPLLLGALALGHWCTWHLRRVRNLSYVTMFEAACLSRWDRAANDRIRDWPSSGDRPLVRLVAAARAWWDTAWSAHDRRAPAQLPPPRLLDNDTVAHVAEVRNRLFLTVPNPAGLLLLIGMLLLALVLWGRIRHTFESAAGTPTFDQLLSFAIAGSLAATTWAVYRLVAIWRALRRVLEDMGATPLLTAFDRLPRETSRLTRLTLVGAPAYEIVTSVRAAQWRQMRNIAEAMTTPPTGASGAAVPREAGEERFWPAIVNLEPGIESGRARCDAFEEEGARFRNLDDLLSELWRTEPTPEQVWTVSGAVREMSLWKDEARPDTGIMFRRSAPGRLRLWVRAAEEFAAVQVVDYIEWVLQHMRTLTWYLFLSLLISTALLSSYPYEPQRTAKLALALVLVGTVGTLVYVMTDMNRDEVLSRIAKTDPGRITWDGAYVLNVSLIAVVPVLTLISSEVPELRQFLFSWLDPVLRILVR